MSKILIIEDEEAIAELEKDYLELSDFEVEIQTDGKKGLEAALEKDYDKISLFANKEGLTAHARAVDIRFGKEDRD